MTIWIISDTHFGHENMYKFVGLEHVAKRITAFQEKYKTEPKAAVVKAPQAGV